MTTKDLTLMKNAEISVLFQVLEGYLMDDIFVEIENNHIRNIYYTENQDLIPTVLYEVEKDLNSLGLDLSDQAHQPYDKELIQEKLKEAFEFDITEVEFEVINRGEELNNIISSSEDSEDLKEDFNKDINEEQSEEIDSELTENFAEIDEFEEIENFKSLILTEDKNEENENGVGQLNLFEVDEENEIKKDLRNIIDNASKEEVESNEFSTTSANGTPPISSINSSETSSTDERELGKSYDENPVETTSPVDMENSEKSVKQEEGPEIKSEKQPEVELVFGAPMEAAKPEKTKAVEFPPYFNDDDAVQEYLNELEINPKIVKSVIKFRAKNRERVKNYEQNIVDVVGKELAYIGSSEVFEKALAAMLVDQPLNLKGPAGTGKTTLLNTISCVFNFPLFSINGSLESNKATLVGELDIKEKGVLSVKDGQMTKAALYGGMLYIDEINMMRPDVLSIVNEFAEYRKTFYNDVRGETIIAHEDTRFVSAMNVGYAGVKKMNEATMDRSVAVKLTYMGKAELIKVLRSTAAIQDLEFFDELSLVEIEKISKIYGNLTQESENLIVPELATSARNVIQIAKLVPVLGFQGAIEMFLDKFEEEESGAILGVLTKDGLAEELGIDIDLISK